MTEPTPAAAQSPASEKRQVHGEPQRPRRHRPPLLCTRPPRVVLPQPTLPAVSPCTSRSDSCPRVLPELPQLAPTPESGSEREPGLLPGEARVPLRPPIPRGRYARFAAKLGLDGPALRLSYLSDPALAAPPAGSRLRVRTLAPVLPVSEIASPEGIQSLGLVLTEMHVSYVPNAATDAIRSGYAGEQLRSDLLISTTVGTPVYFGPRRVSPRLLHAEELLRFRRWNQENYIFAMQSNAMRPRSFWERLRGDRNPPSKYRQLRPPGLHPSVGSFDVPNPKQSIAAAVFPWQFVSRLDNRDNPADLVTIYGNVSYLGFFLSYRPLALPVSFEVAGGVENRGIGGTIDALGKYFPSLLGGELSTYGNF